MMTSHKMHAQNHLLRLRNAPVSPSGGRQQLAHLMNAGVLTAQRGNEIPAVSQKTECCLVWMAEHGDCKNGLREPKTTYR